MKILKLLTYFILTVFLIQLATAANTGYIISYPNGTVTQGCEYVTDGSSALSVLQSAYGVTINSDATQIDGQANNASHSWYLYSNNAGSSFASKDLAYTTTTVGSNAVIGVAYATSNATTNAPTYTSYTTLCPMQLEIADFVVKVGGSSSKDFDEDDIDSYSETGKIKDIEPGSEITLKIEFENKWDDNDEVEGKDEIAIEDVEVTATIKDIDDGDDLEEEDSIDLDSEENGEIEFSFDIPTLVEDEDYQLEIEITSEDDLGRKYNYDIVLDLGIEKERHKLTMDKAELSNENISCSRNTAVNYKLVNVGRKDEDVKLTLTSSNLEVSKTSTFELESYTGDEDDATKSGSLSFTVPESAAAGTYTLTLKAEYDDGDASESKDVTLTVADCVKETPKEEKEEPVVTNTTSGTQTTTGTVDKSVQIVRPISKSDVEEEKGFFKENGMIIGIVIAEIVVLGGVIGLIFAMKKKKY